VYHLIGERSRFYPLPHYQKIFPLIKQQNVIVVKGAGHLIHFDKPMETIEYIKGFLDDIDKK